MSDTPARILVVDDEEMIRVNLRAYFEDEGFTVLTAESGEEALVLLADETVDVGIFDMRLPGMDGNTLILKAHGVQPQMKKIVYTGSTSYSPPPEIMEVGVERDQVFQKPVSDMGILVKCIERLLEEEES